METQFSLEDSDRTIIKELVQLRQFKVDYKRVVERNEFLVSKLSELDVELTEMNVLLESKEIENAQLKKKIQKLSKFDFTGEMNELNALRERATNEVRGQNEFKRDVRQWVPLEQFEQAKEHIEELARERDRLKLTALTQEWKRHLPCKHTATKLPVPVAPPKPALKSPPKTMRVLLSSPRHKKPTYTPSFTRLSRNK